MHVLLGNKGHATLFKNKGNEFILNKKFENLEFMKKESTLFTDRAGSAETSYTSNHVYSESHYKDELVSKFCHEIVDYLTSLDEQGDLSSLTLICGASFLGELRKKITPHLEALINEELSKNFYTEKPHELKLFLKSHDIAVIN